jgi:hypothetical protein
MRDQHHSRLRHNNARPRIWVASRRRVSRGFCATCRQFVSATGWRMSPEANLGFESVEPLHRLPARSYAVGSSRNSRTVADHEPGLDALAIASIDVEHRGGQMESSLLIGPQSTAVALRSHKRNGRRAAVPKQVATHEVSRP